MKAGGLVCGLGLMVIAPTTSGCADLIRANASPYVNPESPVAAEVAAGARRSYPTPSFADVPPTPKDLPQPALIKSSIVAMVRCRQAFEGWEAGHPALSSGSSVFADKLRGEAQVSVSDLPKPGDLAKSEAYAAQLRNFAAPPPPIGSGPPPSADEATAPARVEAGATPRHPPSAAPRPSAPMIAPPQPAEPAQAPAETSNPAVLTPVAPLPAPAADPLLGRCQ